MRPASAWPATVADGSPTTASDQPSPVKSDRTPDAQPSASVCAGAVLTIGAATSARVR
jgi:hypothetical protein